MTIVSPLRGAAIDRAIEAFERGPRELLSSGLWGFEREALRVDAEGRLSTSEHPFAPGRGDITVDFAENQIELVTPPRPGVEDALGELGKLHRLAYDGIGDELLWPLSVPGRWDEPERLRPARFAGVPERGEARRYRELLLERYGRARQAISGLHYNFSLSDEFWYFLARAEGSTEDLRGFANRRYMDLARNFARFSFLPVFLFSASPVIDSRFSDDLARSAGGAARATGAACAGKTASLRLGPLGYRLDDRIACRVDLRLESIEEYVGALGQAIAPRDGSPPLLFSEGELYAPVRPKAAFPGSKASLAALEEKGIEYLELRTFDLDPFEPAGIGEEEARIVHLLALACLMVRSPPLDRGIAVEDPLSRAASACSLGSSARGADRWVAAAVKRAAREPLEMMSRIARIMSAEYGGALSRALAILDGRAPRSAERFAQLARERGGGLEAGLELARAHRAAIMAERKKGTWNT